VRLKKKDEQDINDPMIKLGHYIDMTARFELENEKGKKSIKKIKVVVFNQKSNPQTSVSTFFSGVKGLSFKSIFSLEALAILGFILLFALVVMNNKVCDGYDDTITEQIKKENLDNVLVDRVDDGGIIGSFCRYKSHFVMNLGVAFLAITVIRNVLSRIYAK
jgi:hypothetical protein